MKGSNGKRVLIVGASFAGLSSAWWLSELGYDVAVVEIAPGIRRGGTAVNIQGGTIDIVRRMGLFEQIDAARLSLRRFEFKEADDRTVRSLVLRTAGEPPPDDDYEIERDVLMEMLLRAVRPRCRIVFGDTVTALSGDDRVDVTFRHAAPRSFDLVLGCDGTHSSVRRMWFGEESRYVHALGQYFSITIVRKLLIEVDTAQMYNEPGKGVMLNAYKDRTDIIFNFASDAEIPYDHRDEAQQRRMIAEQFAGVGWRTAELLAEVDGATDFYFDKLCQVRMPSWSQGRVVLVGDAAYCPSPAAGRGGSIAIDGAAALAQAMRAAPDDHALAFRRYDDAFRPFVEQVQDEAERMGVETLVPRTEEAIRERNSKTGPEF